MVTATAYHSLRLVRFLKNEHNIMAKRASIIIHLPVLAKGAPYAEREQSVTEDITDSMCRPDIIS